jgi:hypothetical protein
MADHRLGCDMIHLREASEYGVGVCWLECRGTYARLWSDATLQIVTGEQLDGRSWFGLRYDTLERGK